MVKIVCFGICTQMHLIILMMFNFVNMILTHDCPPMMSGNCFKGFTQRPEGPDMYDDWMVFQGIHSGPRGPDHSRISWVPITMKENA